MPSPPDPYDTLSVDPSASDAELRAAYRRLVQLHHPDHNGGSPESARRFEAVQEAYAQVRQMRASGSGAAARGRGAPGSGAASRGRGAPGSGEAAQRRGAAGPRASAPSGDPELDARVAAMEQELKAARAARERAAREARKATEQTIRDVREMAGERPSDEELGYYSTSDSFSKILDDAASELSSRLSEARDSPAAHRISDLLEELADKLTEERRKHK